ncbi:sirohydrochlorin chelatase [Paractinoplanes durhamensis]|uniref:Cobalamin biosynthesis protein n=1 Tax=Paractinoplanes durhamensis TaxID=113563 RepID=A0ABQ3YNU3_9ACTN|nr:CbiX/SirB N-terminal domain-containing protein [Actinoplanes durhamensis]GID99251.1 cobalamin biosynthesis protein [Actinoplanes durhamensis]
MRPARLSVVLVAHGSRDPRAAAATTSLARAVRRAHPSWDVHATYLDHAGPRPLDVLAGLAPGSRAVVVPLLLTKAYHGRIDIPAVVEAAADLPVSVTLAEVLGPQPAPVAGRPPVPPLLIDGLIRRLPAAGLDAVVLAAAGTRNPAARATVEWASDALSARLGLPCAVAYASAAPPLPAAAVDLLRASGARRIGMAAYFLAPGHLYDLAANSAREAGAMAIAEPLNDAPEIVGLVTARVNEVAARTSVAA